MPEALTVADIRRLTSAGTAPEKEALDDLTAKLDPALKIGLTDLIARNHAADKTLQGMREQSSAVRNGMLNLPYKLMLPLLARRLLYRSLDPLNEELRAATACESNSLSSL